ncbi:hypothetical protein [Mucilaginibacter sp. L3T2-6]|uniref:hypothetical protein n=1 Tax=Mucilaginibacter sp. L3T2-6 TaxID=3062491 RepID=UPI002676C00A|nr:hypothetical protein [Mucilaginibacter sp. L3T2-6]MDO3643975.1 hypothetical protein [Mucilaginibacter sp. L3T2-6]MDV6216302.1 hypothetical protein [Mucilaginibacter sp. L3T2-6]
MNPNHDTDAPNQPSFIPAGWVGGFSGNPPGQPYPNSALLNSLPFLGNLDNIPNITRMLRAKWPEFSWETTPGDATTRMYQMFAPDISRLGYDNTGRVWSIICPQQGVYFPTLGATLNIEVTVTGNRGWIDETADKDVLFASDITIKPTIWFSPDSVDGIFWQQLLKLNKLWNNTLPLSKEKGIRINATDENGLPDIQVRMGERIDWPFPDRAKHWRDYAWAVANLAVRIGNIDSTGNAKADEFNSWVMDLFNIGSGNLLLAGNVLTWNLWAGSPELVNQEEWKNHAAYWRYSIDVNHRPPEGEGTSIADFNGNPFNPGEGVLYAKTTAFALWIGWQLL